jgi:hypothetical protein
VAAPSSSSLWASTVGGSVVAWMRNSWGQHQQSARALVAVVQWVCCIDSDWQNPTSTPSPSSRVMIEWARRRGGGAAASQLGSELDPLSRSKRSEMDAPEWLTLVRDGLACTTLQPTSSRGESEEPEFEMLCTRAAPGCYEHERQNRRHFCLGITPLST